MVVEVVGALVLVQASSAAGRTRAQLAALTSALAAPEVTATSLTPKRVQ